jgi:hypothetical protein
VLIRRHLSLAGLRMAAGQGPPPVYNIMLP